MSKKSSQKVIKNVFIFLIHAALLLFILLMMFVCHWLVYDEHYMMLDSSKVVSYTDMDVCKLICFLFMLLNLIISVIARFYNKFFSVIHFLLSQFGIIYFCWLLTL